MTTKSEPYYWVVCDLCDKRCDYGNYTAWGDDGQASGAAYDHDWFVDISYDCHICRDCLPRYLEDEEDDNMVQPQHGAEGHHCYGSGIARVFRGEPVG